MSRLISIVILGLLILLIVGGYFLWWPKYQEFGDKKLELAGKDIEVRQKEEHFSQLKVVSERLKGYSDELAKINSALPVDLSVPALFNFIQKTSSENGLTLTGISLSGISSPEADKKGIQKILFSISLSGSYSAFKNFLSAIYRNARVIEVKAVSFSSPEEEELFSFDLLLQTHAYQKLEVEKELPEF